MAHGYHRQKGAGQFTGNHSVGLISVWRSIRKTPNISSRYLTDIEHLNYDVIPELHSVGRLGWIDGYGFSPYVDNVVFDGDVSFRSLFDAVKPKGSYDKWLELCKQIRRNGATARIMLAASFASVLVAPCECLPFFRSPLGRHGNR